MLVAVVAVVVVLVTSGRSLGGSTSGGSACPLAPSAGGLALLVSRAPIVVVAVVVSG